MLASGQQQAGHDVRVVGGEPVAMRSALVDGVELVVAGDRVLPVARAVHHAADGADVVHVHMTAAEIAVSLAGTVRRDFPPVVATRHFAAPRGRGPLGPLGAGVARRLVQEQIAISRFVQQSIDGGSVVVYAGTEDQPDSFPQRTRPRQILMAQRLEPEKHADLGLEAFARAGLASDGWTLTIAGDGTERASLEHQASRLGVDGSTEFVGRVSDLPDRLGQAAIFLAPTPGEHFGLSVIEAMAAGTPVVADGSGGHLESLGTVGSAGLFASRDAEAAAARLRQLADSESDRDLLGAGLQARQREMFTVERQVTATDAVYRQVVAR
nr:glycosyltransferase family 4 protein [Luteimicrobium subarcticum]